jgi:hypothetical protein
MKSETGKTKMLAALLLGAAQLPVHAADLPQSRKETSKAAADFKSHDTDKDGFLSMDEFLAKGKDDLAFRAADIDGDGRVDPGEYAKYLEAQATDQPRSGAAGQPEPAVPSAPRADPKLDPVRGPSAPGWTPALDRPRAGRIRT